MWCRNPHRNLSAALASGNASYQLCWAALNFGLILSLLDAECPWQSLEMPGLKTGALSSRTVSTSWGVEALDVEFHNWGYCIPWSSPFPWPPTGCGKHQFPPSLKGAGCLAGLQQGQMQSHIQRKVNLASRGRRTSAKPEEGTREVQKCQDVDSGRQGMWLPSAEPTAPSAGLFLGGWGEEAGGKRVLRQFFMLWSS